MVQEQAATLQLPLSVVSQVDIGRLMREVDALEGYLEAVAVREPGTEPKMPKTSRLLDELLQQNKLNGLHKADRHRLKSFLEAVKTQAPVLHMSFSADPSSAFTHKLVAWLRQEIHPLVLLQIGLQPTIGAGTIVRTTNKQFDFSLRQRFIDSRQLLIDRLHKAMAESAEVRPVQPLPAEGAAE